MLKSTITSIRITIVLLLIVCGAYPLLIWAAGQTAFRYQANGSLVKDANGQVIGSELLAQGFTKAQYFQPRQSAAGSGYDPTESSGTNLGPTSDKLINGIPAKIDGKPNPAITATNSAFDGVKQLAVEYRTENNLPADAPVPVDAVTRSGSGLDPDISVANANLQAPRVAAARSVSVDVINAAVKAHTTGRALGILGEPAVNVLMLNLDLDKHYPVKS